MDERPGYYAIIPADVRYDDRIPANAKLLYGEISALIGKDGFCFASNQYFADIYKCTPVTVARLVSKLEDAGYIKRELEKDQTGQVVRRKLFLSVSAPDVQPLNNFDNTPQQNCGEGINKNDKDTNTSITVIDINKENKKENPPQEETQPPKKRKSPSKADFDPLPLFVDWIGQNFGDAPRNDKNALYQALLGLTASRKENGYPIKSKTSVTALCNRLLRLGGSSIPAMIDMLSVATSSGWRTVYPPKGPAKAPPPEKSRRVEEWL